MDIVYKIPVLIGTKVDTFDIYYATVKQEPKVTRLPLEKLSLVHICASLRLKNVNDLIRILVIIKRAFV